MELNLSLNIATYRAPESLRLLLESVARQTRLPNETLILEDGGCAETQAVVAAFASRIPRLRYVQQADRGFRLAQLRNLGIIHSTGSYLVSIDGDLILHPHFIADHVRAARPGYFVQGVRQKLSPAVSARLLSEVRQPKGWERIAGREKANKSRWWGLRSCTLAAVFSRTYTAPRKISGCHQAFFKADLVKINGYENRFIGWGEEDQNLADRLSRTGLLERHLRYSAIVWHLYHPSRPRVNQHTDVLPEPCAKDGYRELCERLQLKEDACV